MATTERQLMDVRDVLKEYRNALPPGLSTRTGLYMGIAKGWIPAIRMGRRLYVVRSKLEAVLNGDAPSAAAS